jgi:hypothetical protein
VKEPDWRDAPCGGEYHPSANIPPTSYTPVLLLQSHTEGEEEEEARVIKPMMWGLIPPWHHGEDPKGSGLSSRTGLFPPKFASRQNLFTAKICFPPKHGQLVIFPAHLRVAIGLQLHILNKHGGKEFTSYEKYAILRKKIFLNFLLLEHELMIEIGWLYLSLM